MKYFIVLTLSIFCSSCAWIAAHPQLEADLKKEGIDMAKDTEKVIEDAISAVNSDAKQKTEEAVKEKSAEVQQKTL